MSSFSGTPTLSLTSSQAAPASPAIATEAAKTTAWHTALYLVVVFAIVSIIATIIILVGHVEWTIPTPTRWRAKMETSRPSFDSTSTATSTSYFPLGSMLVRMMLRYFFATVLPPLQSLRTATMSSMGTLSRPQPILPLFTAPGFRQPMLTPLRPAVHRDDSFRVPSNPYSGSSGLLASHPNSNLPSPAH